MIGGHSYSIYLWHAAVLSWGIWLGREILGARLTYPLVLFIYFVGSILVGMAMSQVFEDPVLKLRNRMFPSQSGNPATQR
jgi:peptidoglycan/LPS O-acetylase OafA/YrhL